MQIVIKFSIDVCTLLLMGHRTGRVEWGVSAICGPTGNKGVVDLIYIVAKNTPINNESKLPRPELFLLG